MKSPFTGGKVTKKHRLETFTFRKEEFTVERYFFVCNDTGREFTDDSLDDQMLSDIYKQYRERHGIPSPEELKSFRLEYGISAHTMSIIAGMGINQYGLYENGEMPTVAMGRRLASLFDKQSLLDCIDKAQLKLGKNYLSIRGKVLSHNEPSVIPLAKHSYKDYTEIIRDSMAPKEISIRQKSRWSTIKSEYTTVS